MKQNVKIYSVLLSFMLLTACHSERYRVDKKNQMSEKDQAKNNFASNQAVKLTQENIDNRKVNEKAGRKRAELQQEQLNELNAKESKVKKNKKHSGNYKFY